MSHQYSSHLSSTVVTSTVINETQDEKEFETPNCFFHSLNYYLLLGLLPQVTPCMRRLNYDMMNCYNEAGLNPDLFSPEGSRMNGAIIGDNREIAAMYCE